MTGRKRDTGKGNLYGLILAGGVGSRFWPLSRETTPKQLLKVVGEESLLEGTIKRLNPLIPPSRVSIITNSRQAGIIKTHLAGQGKGHGKGGGKGTAGISDVGYVVEPMGRNTAPAIGLAALDIVSRDEDGIMAVLPADHLIGDKAAFRRSLKVAKGAAAKGGLVTLGIVPTRAETGYGYIKQGKRPAGEEGVYPVDRFVEKPDLKKAKGYVKDGGYLWNGGIFIWKASRILEEIEVHLPAIYKGLMEIRDGGDAEKIYSRMEAISIDHGILEKAKGVVVIPVDFDWSDVGSWESFGEVLKTDKRGNVIRGEVLDNDSEGSVIIGCDRVVATIGLKDMIVVDTPDATLVCTKERAQEVRGVVDTLKKNGYSEHEYHQTVERPWGRYKVLEEGPSYKIKKITVDPGRRLSLQRHKFRSEHWVVTEGRGKVTRGGEVIRIKTNESTYIPKGVKHRLENTGKVPLHIIEVQNGSYLGEDDIIRYDDDFDRA